MADKSFGVRQLNLIGTGTPTIESTGNINLDANKVAISTDVTVGRNLNVSGVSTFTGLLDANGGAAIDNLRLGTAADNEITTSTGNLVLDSNAGTIEVDDNLTVTGVATFQNHVDLGNDDRLRFGDSQDLEIYSNGSSSFIKESGSGNLKVLGNSILFKNTQDTEFYADFNSGGSVDLYHANSKKFETTGYGVTVSGGAYVSGIITATDGFNIGISSSGTTIATGSVKSLNFVGSGNTFFYNTSTKTVDITIQGGSDVTQGTYGDARFVPQITVNADGAISDISEVEIFSNGLGNDLNINSNDITGTGNINITGNITVSGTGNKFFGDGSGLTGIVAQGSGITLKLNGTTVGLAQTVDFVGAGVTAIENVEGTATVYLPTANRTLSRIIATNGQTSITGLSYTIGAVDVYLNGGRLDTTEFTATNGTSITLTTGASVNDIIEVVAHQITSSAPSSSTITQEESIAFAIALG